MAIPFAERRTLRVIDLQALLCLNTQTLDLKDNGKEVIFEKVNNLQYTGCSYRSKRGLDQSRGRQ